MSQLPASKCPVPHDKREEFVAKAAAASSSSSPSSPPKGCPVDHTKTPSPPKGCPVDHTKHASSTPTPTPAPVASPEPADTPDRSLSLPTSHSSDAYISANGHNNLDSIESNDPADQIPGTKIPASGRGNSDDGASWVNPSANQLYRALRRREKPIEHKDAMDVAFVHTMVTEMSWDAVMEYENLHKE